MNNLQFRSSSPPSTSDEAQDPIEKIRNWLAQHGISQEKVERMLDTHTRRVIGIDNELRLLQTLQQNVKHLGFSFVGEGDDLNEVEFEFKRVTERKNIQIAKKASQVIHDQHLQIALKLSNPLRTAFYNFLRRDDLYSRNTFIQLFLPWMTEKIQTDNTHTATTPIETAVETLSSDRSFQRKVAKAVGPKRRNGRANDRLRQVVAPMSIAGRKSTKVTGSEGLRRSARIHMKREIHENN